MSAPDAAAVESAVSSEAFDVAEADSAAKNFHPIFGSRERDDVSEVEIGGERRAELVHDRAMSYGEVKKAFQTFSTPVVRPLLAYSSARGVSSFAF